MPQSSLFTRNDLGCPVVGKSQIIQDGIAEIFGAASKGRNVPDGAEPALSSGASTTMTFSISPGCRSSWMAYSAVPYRTSGRVWGRLIRCTASCSWTSSRKVLAKSRPPAAAVGRGPHWRLCVAGASQGRPRLQAGLGGGGPCWQSPVGSCQQPRHGDADRLPPRSLHACPRRWGLAGLGRRGRGGPVGDCICQANA